jgi:Fur family transcriptional regulator, ferric uptake regulator
MTPSADDRKQPSGRLKALLRQEGFRLTTQRQKILDLFTQAGGQHLSAEEVHQHLTALGEHISPSTIYRTLHVMAEIGLIRELELAEDKKYYELAEPTLPAHHHLVCVHCGALVEFEADIMAQIGTNQAEMRGYRTLDCQFTVYGVCSRCQRL